MLKGAYYLILDIVVNKVIHINKYGSVNLRLIHLYSHIYNTIAGFVIVEYL